MYPLPINFCLQARLPGTEDKLFASLCTSGSLLAIVTSSCGAQFSSEDGIEKLVVGCCLFNLIFCC